MIGNIISGVTGTVKDFIEDPVGETINHTLSPVQHSLDILQGLSEGEIRTLAALKLGADVAAGMAVNELIEVLMENLDE